MAGRWVGSAEAPLRVEQRRRARDGAGVAAVAAGGIAGVEPRGRAGVRGEATATAAMGGAGARAGEAASLVR